MEKAVLIEMCPTCLKMTTIALIGGGYNKKINEIKETIRFDEDIYDCQAITIPKLNEAIKQLNLFKAICQNQGILKIYCYASTVFSGVRNPKSLFEEINNNTGFSFTMLSQDEEVKFTYNTVLNAVEPNKAVVLYLNPNDTIMINFAKRNVLSTNLFNFGTNSLAFKFADKGAEDTKEVLAEVEATAKEYFDSANLDLSQQETGFIGGGDTFVTLSKLVRKIKKYPLAQDNNMPVSREDFDKAYAMLLEQGFDKNKRMSSITDDRLTEVLIGFAIIKAYYEKYEIETIYVTSKTISDAVIAAKIVKETSSESNAADVLETSLDTLRYYYAVEDSNADWVYNLTLILFKQMSIVHKLTRKYVKALRIAAHMYDCGKRIEHENHTRFSKDVIINSRILGASHKDIVVAAFACQYQNPENFQLEDWIKYRAIVDEEDLMAVKKIGMIIRIAASLDFTKLRKVYDINCDLLGDIVIVKVKSNESVEFEIANTHKLGGQFKKTFNKNIQII